MGIKVNTETFIEKAMSVHGDVYDYSEVVYVNTKSPIIIICKTHGKFTVTPNSHLSQKIGCPLCSGHKTSAEDVIKKATEIHGGRFSYEHFKYVNMNTKGVIVCHIHGKFQQSMAKHLYQQTGCPKCGYKQSADKLTSSIGDKIQLAKKKHGEVYNYDNIPPYSRVTDVVPIICPTHGEYNQILSNHIHNGHGCRKCCLSVSAPEQEIATTLRELGVKVVSNSRKIIPPLELDIYLPEFNIAIEFNGLYWHTDKHLPKNYHLNKTLRCEEQNIRLIHIFEDEWRDMRTKCMDTIIHLLGKSKKGVYARQTTIREIPWKTAKDFLNKHHLLDAGTSGNYRIGAYDKEDNLIGVMVFGQQNNEGSRGIELKRFVTNKHNNPGLGSKMFKYATMHQNYTTVTAFVDRRWFTGLVKSYIGFELVDVTEPTIWWTDYRHRWHRRFVTKKQLIAQGHNPALSKSRILADKNVYKIWDCGKLKLQWKNTRNKI